MESIDALKHSAAGPPKYRLANANVFVSVDGFHFIDYLDPVTNLSPEVNCFELTAQKRSYIETALQSNLERFERQVDAIKRSVYSISGQRVLDIGCGGGLFLSMLRERGAVTVGIELDDSRACYAITKYKLEVIKRPVEDGYWMSCRSTFDVVTLWDVIEHVNYPELTLRSAAGLLKSKGLLFIDTPCRDGLYHRLGELTYKLSGGQAPTFLNAMYSAHKFGHKQIFSALEMKVLLEQAGFDVIELTRFHELSFPISFYLKKMLGSEWLVKLALPLVSALLHLFPVKNKMLVVGRKW